MRFFEDVQTTVLENGFTVVTHHVPGHLQTAAGIVVCSGAFHENPNKGTGFFHMNEHLFPSSHPIMTKFDYADRTRELCVNAGLQTGSDSMEALAHGITHRVWEWMDMAAMMIASGAFTTEDVEKERGRIWNEMNDREASRETQQIQAAMDAFFGMGSAASRPIGGYTRDIERITYDDMRNLRQEHVVGNNMMFVTAGGMTHAEAVEFARAHFEHLPPGRRQPRYQGKMHMQDLFLPEPEQENKSTSFQIHFNASDVYAAHKKKVGLLSVFLKHILFSEISLRQGRAYAVDVGFDVANPNEARMNISSSCQPEKLVEMVGQMREVLSDLLLGSPKFNDHFEMVKRTVRNAAEEHAANLLYNMPAACTRLISEFQLSGCVPDPRQDLAVLESVTYAEAVELIGQILKAANPCVEYRGHTAGLPTGPEIGAILGFAPADALSSVVRPPFGRCVRRLAIAS